ncbi:putative splicing factor, arginine/serine-rich 8 [Neospora caninum Liverpool]|uniref:Putative splicing factor, arginine/serine-rich 8 n=1 Tax=Neospora caninum (strain Liverpool) TaxID=572307 RepID=F0VJ65_NEOCL|nr:putative splicing factor, arginine/serine-rich 8 [Neospora caninum Liverpool]CBZ53776.1 putative splicing factor, arginine/serine-rich 8 [Neospora caninum Liverpool]CEL67769.1 TPA: splicing factor, arginine/serine-rich 8,putative [Neospora caninum Liverpool]|eukprot:XP_003883808.1 putative splicing factor, arginine/serine-rich 8 [Neospora caninum Liverpool]
MSRMYAAGSRGSGPRPNEEGRTPKEDRRSAGTGLFCVGYACKYFCSEEEWKNLDKRLIPLNGDEDNLVDRYDVRLLLSDADAFTKKKRTYTSDQLREILEETPALDRERYRDLPPSNLFEEDFLERLAGAREGSEEAWTPTRELQQLRESRQERRDRASRNGEENAPTSHERPAPLGDEDAAFRLGDMSAVPPPASLDGPGESESVRSPREGAKGRGGSQSEDEDRDVSEEREETEERETQRGEREAEDEGGRTQRSRRRQAFGREDEESDRRKRSREDEAETRRSSETPGVKREEDALEDGETSASEEAEAGAHPRAASPATARRQRSAGTDGTETPGGTRKGRERREPRDGKGTRSGRRGVGETEFDSAGMEEELESRNHGAEAALRGHPSRPCRTARVHEAEDAAERETRSDAPFVPPFPIPRDKVPHLPRSLKEHLVIERTAHFVRTEGSRMEFRLKLDAATSSQLCFLSVDHPLHPYYAYLRQTGEALLLHAPGRLPPKLLFLSKLVYTHLPASSSASREARKDEGVAKTAGGKKERVETEEGRAAGDRRDAPHEGEPGTETGRLLACGDAAAGGVSPRGRREERDREERNREARDSRLPPEARRLIGPEAESSTANGEADRTAGKGRVGSDPIRSAREDSQAAPAENALFQAAEEDGGVSLLMSYGTDDEDEQLEAEARDEARPKTGGEERENGGDENAQQPVVCLAPGESRGVHTSPGGSEREAAAESETQPPAAEEASEAEDELDPVWQSGTKLRVAFVLERRKRKRPAGGVQGRGDSEMTQRPGDVFGGAGDGESRDWTGDEEDPAAVAEALAELPPLAWAKANAKLQLKDVESLIIHQIGCWLLAKGDEAIAEFAQQMTTEDPRFFFLKRDTLAFCYFKYVLRCVCREKQRQADGAKTPLPLRLHPVARAFLARLRFEHHLAHKTPAPDAKTQSSEVLTQDAINENAAAASAASAAAAAEAAAIEEARAAEALARRHLALSGLCGDAGPVSPSPLAEAGAVAPRAAEGVPTSLGTHEENPAPFRLSAEQPTPHDLAAETASATASLAASGGSTGASPDAAVPAGGSVWGAVGLPAVEGFPADALCDPAALVTRAIANPALMPAAVNLVTQEMGVASAEGDAPRYAMLYAAYCQLCAYATAVRPSSASPEVSLAGGSHADGGFFARETPDEAAKK